MRIISGTAKGMKLKAPKGKEVRPTSDRVREAFFSIISHRLEDAAFLDLYAGSGAIGIEALSRGAKETVFIDNKRENILLIRENLSRAKLSEKARLIKNDADKALARLFQENYKAGLIYMDPPYCFTRIPEVIQKLYDCQIACHNSLITVEHSYHNRGWVDLFPGARQKRYGDTCLTFIEHMA